MHTGSSSTGAECTARVATLLLRVTSPYPSQLPPGRGIRFHPVGVVSVPTRPLYYSDLDPVGRGPYSTSPVLYGPPVPSSSSTSTTSSTTTSTTTTTTSTTTWPTTPTPTELDICNLRHKLNTFLVVRNRLYAFYDKYVWILSLNEAHRTREEFTNPLIITEWLTFLPSDKIDVSFSIDPFTYEWEEVEGEEPPAKKSHWSK
ncbi:hypothetical protein J6590_085383 [Homalodisca vitripennis]|nr:hypothetical protein J6590_085383 [Homalodisca vitripennis]